MEPNIYSRILGALFAHAIGDALGVTIEFDPRRPVGKYHTTIKGAPKRGFGKGEWTDDTAMMLAVAEGILANPATPMPHIGHRFYQWAITDGRGMGGIVAAAFLRRFRDGMPWRQAAELAHHDKDGLSAGNGSLMRTLPVALVYHRDRTLMRQVAEAISGMTHYDRQATVACLFFCEMAAALLEGANRQEAFEQAWSQVLPACEEQVPAEFFERIKRAPHAPRDEVRAGYGYVLDALEAAVWAFMTTNTLEDCILEAVNLGGDADTYGAIAGGLAGCHYGFGEIPDQWLAALSDQERLGDVYVGICDQLKAIDE